MSRNTTTPSNVVRRYAHSLGAALSGNAHAFGYSIAITASFGAVSAQLGSPDLPSVLTFALGGVLAFTVMQAGAVALITRDAEVEERERVTLLATATDFFSVGLAVLVAAGVAALVGGWVGWGLSAFCASAVYVLVQALELRVAESSS